MKRVASLYLPDWPIERIVRAAQGERPASPPSAAAGPDAFDALGRTAAAERAATYSVPRGGGWRPGARWAQPADVAGGIGDTADRAKSRRRSGRTSETVDHPFKTMPPDDGGTATRDARLAIAPMQRPSASIPSSSRAQIDARRTRRGMSGTPYAPATPAIPAIPPMVTSRQEGNKLVLAAVSPAARAAGLAPGMAVTHARALVPGIDIRPADTAGDRAALEALALLAARRWCPAVMLSGPTSDDHGLFLDVTGTTHLFGGEARMLRRIVRLLAQAGFTARVAVADTAGAAWALARFGAVADVVVCPSTAQVEALAPLPVTALRLEPAAVELLRRLGIATIGQLAALPRAPLARRFGGRLVARLDQAAGRLPEPLDPVVPPEAVVVRQRFAEPIATAEAIAHWIGVLMPRLVVALAEAGQGARAVELVADRIDGVPQTLRIGLARPTRDAAHLLRLTLRRIEEIAPGYGIDALALHVRRADPLEALPFAETLEETPSGLAPDLAPLVDTLANRIGSHALWRSKPVESDVPERSVAATDPLDPPDRPPPRIRHDDVRQLDRGAPAHPWELRWPRPVRLLRRPERVEDVVALLPDQPPRRFTWRGTTHRVVRADGPERIHGEWWKRTSEANSVRDYFRVEDEHGARFWLFRRGDGERAETGDLAWFMHGAFG